MLEHHGRLALGRSTRVGHAFEKPRALLVCLRAPGRAQRAFDRAQFVLHVNQHRVHGLYELVQLLGVRRARLAFCRLDERMERERFRFQRERFLVGHRVACVLAEV